MVTYITPAPMLTVKEVAWMLHIHENTVRRWSGRGILKSYRIGPRGDRRFKRADINFLLTRLKQNHGDERTSMPNKQLVEQSTAVPL